MPAPIVQPGSPAAQRRVSVAAERLDGWVERFGARHGDPIVDPLPGRGPVAAGWCLVAPDGAEALLTNRWLEAVSSSDLTGVLTHLTRDRRLGLILARKGAHAVGIARGATLEVSKVDTHYVQGRTKAGGWSQQRYARRRDNQATKSWQAAASDVATRLLPDLESIDAVVCGGDKTSIEAILADTRLHPLAARVIPVVLPTADPRLAVLQKFVDEARSTTIVLNELA